MPLQAYVNNMITVGKRDDFGEDVGANHPTDRRNLSCRNDRIINSKLKIHSLLNSQWIDHKNALNKDCLRGSDKWINCYVSKSESLVSCVQRGNSLCEKRPET